VKVKYIDLPRQAHAEEMLSDIKELLLKTGQFTLGSEVKEFETEFAKLCQTRYAIGINYSGTDALFLSMKVLNIGPDDENGGSQYTAIVHFTSEGGTGDFAQKMNLADC